MTPVRRLQGATQPTRALPKVALALTVAQVMSRERAQALEGSPNPSPRLGRGAQENGLLSEPPSTLPRGESTAVGAGGQHSRDRARRCLCAFTACVARMGGDEQHQHQHQKRVSHRVGSLDMDRREGSATTSGGEERGLLLGSTRGSGAPEADTLRRSPSWGVVLNAIVYMAAPMSMPATMASRCVMSESLLRTVLARTPPDDPSPIDRTAL